MISELEALPYRWMCYLKGVSAKTFEDLIVWQKAHKYVLSVYAITEKFPKSEMFGLSSQMRRAAPPYRQISRKDLRSEVGQTRLGF